jgi:hypothetical protein
MMLAFRAVKISTFWVSLASLKDVSPTSQSAKMLVYRRIRYLCGIVSSQQDREDREGSRSYYETSDAYTRKIDRIIPE